MTPIRELRSKLSDFSRIVLDPFSLRYELLRLDLDRIVLLRSAQEVPPALTVRRRQLLGDLKTKSFHGVRRHSELIKEVAEDILSPRNKPETDSLASRHWEIARLSLQEFREQELLITPLSAALADFHYAAFGVIDRVLCTTGWNGDQPLDNDGKPSLERPGFFEELHELRDRLFETKNEEKDLISYLACALRTLEEPDYSQRRATANSYSPHLKFASLDEINGLFSALVAHQLMLED